MLDEGYKYMNRSSDREREREREYSDERSRCNTEYTGAREYIGANSGLVEDELYDEEEQ